MDLHLVDSNVFSTTLMLYVGLCVFSCNPGEPPTEFRLVPMGKYLYVSFTLVCTITVCTSIRFHPVYNTMFRLFSKQVYHLCLCRFPRLKQFETPGVSSNWIFMWLISFKRAGTQFLCESKYLILLCDVVQSLIIYFFCGVGTNFKIWFVVCQVVALRRFSCGVAAKCLHCAAHSQ